MFDVENIDGENALVLYPGTKGYKAFRDFLFKLMLAKLTDGNVNIIDMMTLTGVRIPMLKKMLEYNIITTDTEDIFAIVDVAQYFGTPSKNIVFSGLSRYANKTETKKPDVNVLAGDNIDTAMKIMENDETIYFFRDRVVSEEEVM